MYKCIFGVLTLRSAIFTKVDISILLVWSKKKQEGRQSVILQLKSKNWALKTAVSGYIETLVEDPREEYKPK